MDLENPPTDLSRIPEFEALAADSRAQLITMRENMQERGLPPALVIAGLKSTARLLLEQQAAQAPRVQSAHVRRFIEENNARTVIGTSPETPRNESRRRSRDALHERVGNLLLMARQATRRHEILRARREMLALDQGFVRRALGPDGARLCDDINAWLMEAGARLKRGS
jgi:hypothetical protein